MGNQATFVKTYDYVGAAGDLHFQTVRYPGILKHRRPDGNGGWIYDLRGIRLVPYNLPTLLKAEILFIVEDEQACDVLRTAGSSLATTTSPLRAMAWRTEFSEHLRGKRVVILLPNDVVNKKRAHSIARSLLGIAAASKVVDLSHGRNVKSWFAQGGTLGGLAKVVEHTPVWMPSQMLPDDHAAGLDCQPVQDEVEERGSALSEAEGFLHAILKQEPMSANQIRREAERAGIAYGTLRRAADRLGIRHRKVGGFGGDPHWYWSLAIEGVQNRTEDVQGAQEAGLVDKEDAQDRRTGENEAGDIA